MSPQLMYGNLICISPNGKFDDIIWATVAERDADILNKSCIIMVQVRCLNLRPELVSAKNKI